MNMTRLLTWQSLLFTIVTVSTICFTFLKPNHSYLVGVLPLILVITLFGVPHGALDTLFAKKAFSLMSVKQWASFVSIYLLISACVIALWWLLPTLFLVIFLLFSALHFADDLGLKETKALRFLYGANIILLPSIFYSSHLTTLYSYLIDSAYLISLVSLFNVLAYVCGLMTVVLLVNLSRKIDRRQWLDTLCVSLLMLLVQPLLAFTIYFCFMHSARHLIRAKYFFADDSSATFLVMLIVPTIVVIIFCGIVFSLMPTQKIDENLVKITFAGLAALTFPHAFLLNKIGFLKRLGV